MLSNKPKLSIPVGVVMLLLALGCSAAPDLGKLWRAARSGTYESAAAAELSEAQRLFEAELAGASTTTAAWQALGIERFGVTVADRACAILREAIEARRGRGFYLFCAGADNTVALQVPHAITDLHTGAIGATLAAGGRFAVVAWNTVRRRTETEGRLVEADLAHLHASYFTALTEAIANSEHIDRVVQIHGFAASRRRSAAAARAAFIVSAGTRNPPPAIAATAALLQREFSLPALVYPRDTRELGGTTNRSGEILRRAGFEGFLHLEMNRGLRDRLRADEVMAARLAAVLAP